MLETDRAAVINIFKGASERQVLHWRIQQPHIKGWGGDHFHVFGLCPKKTIVSLPEAPPRTKMKTSDRNGVYNY